MKRSVTLINTFQIQIWKSIIIFLNNYFIQFERAAYSPDVGATAFTGAAVTTNANIEKRENRRFRLLFSQS